MRILDNTGLVQDPFHLGAVILDKLIGDLKSKLPFLAKKKADHDDFDDEEIDGDDTATETEVSSDDDDKTSVGRASGSADEGNEEVRPDNSLVGKIKARLNSLKKKKSTHDEDLEAAIADEVEGAEAKPAKKKPNFVFVILAVGAIAYLLLSELEEETPAPANPEAMLKKRPKKQPKETPAETPPATDTAATPPTEPAPTETTPAEATTTTTTETPVTEPTTPAEADPVETPPTETPVDTATTAPETTTPDTTTTPPVDTTTPAETVTTAPEDTTTPPAETTIPPTDNATTDSVNGEETKGSEDNLTEQILKDLENQAQGTQKEKPVKTEYVTPPNYENVGRGLVYNCTGKHWACIDGPSYKTCEENASSTKFLNKKSECYPFNVYETQGGCEKMQNRMVSSSAKTEFCGE